MRLRDRRARTIAIAPATRSPSPHQANSTPSLRPPGSHFPGGGSFVRRSLILTCAPVAVVVGLAAAVPPAHAAFPGRNGMFALHTDESFDEDTVQEPVWDSRRAVGVHEG